MSNARKIVIMADAAISDSPIDSQTLGPVRFRRGDDLLVEATFLQNGIVADMSAAQGAVLEILDVGSMNAPDPRTVALLMRKEVVEFSNPICNSSGKLNLEADGQVPHAVFKFSNIETQIASGERWLCLRVEFSDGSKLSFASGWIFVEENFLSDPELLPIENPQYIKRDEAGLLFLNKSANLSDLESKDMARSNLDIYSKLETKSLISESLEFLPAYKEELESIKGDVESAKNIAISTVDEAEQAVSEITLLASDLEKLKEDVQIAKQAAEAAAQEAQAISDPDGLLQKHDSEIAELQLGKANISEHLFEPSSYLKIPNSGLLNTDVFSICFLTDYDFQTIQSENVWKPFCLGGFSGTEAGTDARLYAAVGSDDRVRLYSGTSVTSFKISNFRQGSNQKWNSICFVFYKSAAPKLYVNGVSVEAASTNVPSDYPTAIDNFYLNTAYSTVVSQTSVNVSYRNVLAVNFDMSAEDAPYTVADYAAGKSVPLTLRKEAGIYSTDPDMGASTGAGWAINAPSGSSITTRGDWRCFSAVYYAYNRTADLPDGVSYAIDLSTKPKSSSTGDAYLANMGLGNLADFSGKTIKGKLSFWYKKNNTDSSSYLGAMISKSVLGEITSAEVGDTNWHYFEADVETELTGTSGFYLGVYSYAASGTFTDYPWSIADFKFETYGEKLELADFRSGYQIKDLSGNGNHATIFGEVLSRKNENPTTMQVNYTWGAGVSTGAYVMGDTVTLPSNSEIEVLAKSSASATLSLGTSSSASTTFANAKTVGTTAASIAKFYTTSTAQKLFATPSVAGLTINLTLKITSLK